MTAVMPRPATTAPQRDSRPPRRARPDTDLHTWVLSVQDWRVHALADPAELPMGEALATRCQHRHLIASPLSVARRGEVCPRCMAGGVELLELLPDRTAAEKGHPW